ncbi:M81 family metallopeptidase [Oceanimonas doudoroffii]|uniref:Microcystinase C n=1 Tax=Oceanimonas doudoroffii TaxID=84158 RepID=A0A233RFJ5_9GAMM|nr:M81 family metallopeptidase [Oceanimonas doudoroffii]OXY82165.1 hypothetical protein B6S08_01090 [Oceanimonas doudoroffii]
MHLFIATLSTETNTFSPLPTSLQNYEDYFLRHGTATQEPPNLMTEALHVWRERAEALGWQVTESLAAIAEPAGRTTKSAYAALKGEIIDDLNKAGQLDVVLLQLHGAMVAEGVDDCEGDITQAVRALCPNAVIGIGLDLHCHLTPAMEDACDLIIMFKEYPHDDASDRAHEIFELAQRTATGEIKPVMASYDCRMISLYLTKEGAMRDFVQHMQALEQEHNILSVSLAHGFPWADLEEVGTRVLVITDADHELAANKAQELGRRLFAERHAVTRQYPDLDEALALAATVTDGPVVLADMSDNSGAGAPGDATYVLQEVLKRGLTNVASGLYWDPMAVRFCLDAGEGAEITLRLGGKVESASGSPVDIRGRIMRIADNVGQHLGAGLEPLGTVVWFQAENGVDLIINNLRIQVYHPEAFEQMGIDLSQKSLIVVKSLFHFYTPFAAISSKVIFCATPGRVNPNINEIVYQDRALDFWPAVENPFENEAVAY